VQCNQTFILKTEGMKRLKRRGRRYEVNIKIDVQGKEFEDVGLIRLYFVTAQLRALTNPLMELRRLQIFWPAEEL
jgi:hypothetical protein